MKLENECTMCVRYVPIVGAMCSQCVIDEVDTKLEDLLNLVNSTRHWSPYKIENLKDQLVAIRDEIRPLVSC